MYQGASSSLVLVFLTIQLQAGVSQFHFTLNVQSVVPETVYVHKFSGTKTVKSYPIPKRQNEKDWQILGNALSDTKYICETENGTVLVTSTLDTRNYDKEFTGNQLGANRGKDLFVVISKVSRWSSWSSWSQCSKSCKPDGRQIRQRSCDTFPRFLTEKHECMGDAEDSRICNNVSCTDCLFEEFGSPGNKIGGKNEFHQNITTVSECQAKCKYITNATRRTCDYFTYYDGNCILKSKNAKWNLIYNPGRTTGSRECLLKQKNATTSQTTDKIIVETTIETISNFDNDSNTVIGGIVGAVAVFLAIFLTVFIFLLYKKRRDDSNRSKDEGARINDHGADYDMAYADNQHPKDEDLMNNSSDHEITQNPYYGVENENESNVDRKVQAITIVDNMYYQ